MPLPLTSIQADATETVRARFHQRRRDANLAFLDWLRELPNPQDVVVGIAASIAVLCQLAPAGAE